MPDRARPIRKEICLNEQELSLIRHKMNQLGTCNFGAYARKMLIDGYIIKVDYTEKKKLAAAVSRAASSKRSAIRSRAARVSALSQSPPRVAALIPFSSLQAPRHNAEVPDSISLHV